MNCGVFVWVTLKMKQNFGIKKNLQFNLLKIEQFENNDIKKYDDGMAWYALCKLDSKIRWCQCCLNAITK